MKRIVEYPPRYEFEPAPEEPFWVVLGVTLLLVVAIYVLVCMVAVLAAPPNV